MRILSRLTIFCQNRQLVCKYTDCRLHFDEIGCLGFAYLEDDTVHAIEQLRAAIQIDSGQSAARRAGDGKGNHHLIGSLERTPEGQAEAVLDQRGQRHPAAGRLLTRTLEQGFAESNCGTHMSERNPCMSVCRSARFRIKDGFCRS